MAVVASVMMLSATASLAKVTVAMKEGKHTEAYLRERVNAIYQSKNVDRDNVYCTTRYKEVYKTASDFAEECDEIFLDYEDYVYGRDIYKGEKKGIGYEIIKNKPHAFYFSMSLDTSTNGRLYFATEADANSFYERTSRTAPFYFEDNSTSTMFAIHRPTCEGEFYMIEVEIYV